MSLAPVIGVNVVVGMVAVRPSLGLVQRVEGLRGPGGLHASLVVLGVNVVVEINAVHKRVGDRLVEAPLRAAVDRLVRLEVPAHRAHHGPRIVDKANLGRGETNFLIKKKK